MDRKRHGQGVATEPRGAGPRACRAGTEPARRIHDWEICPMDSVLNFFATMGTALLSFLAVDTAHRIAARLVARPKE